MMTKKLFLALFMCVLFCVSLFGQEEIDLFVKSVSIVKILSHPLGYKVYYLKANADFDSFYVPVEWFRGAANKGAIIWGRAPEYPYFSIFWQNKEFSYIKLFLNENLAHDSWGVLEANRDVVKDKFAIETLELKF